MIQAQGLAKRQSKKIIELSSLEKKIKGHLSNFWSFPSQLARNPSLIPKGARAKWRCSATENTPRCDIWNLSKSRLLLLLLLLSWLFLFVHVAPSRDTNLPQCKEIIGRDVVGVVVATFTRLLAWHPFVTSAFWRNAEFGFLLCPTQLARPSLPSRLSTCLTPTCHLKVGLSPAFARNTARVLSTQWTSRF